MNNIFKKSVIAGSAVLVFAVFAFAFTAFPHSASAQTYNGYNCAFPTVYSNGYWSCSQPTVTYVQPTPTYPTYPTYPSYPSYPQLSVSCYPNSSSVQTGTSVQWVATPSGGTGQYSYSWSGTDGLTGTGQTAAITYYNSGTKTASVSIYSGGQSANATCTNYVTVYNNQPTYNYPTYPTYPSYPTTTYYSPLSVSCVANTSYAPLGTAVTWSASATGGNGYYSYSWSGTDGIYGQGQAITYTYNSSGTKYASVTVYSNGQTLTQPCSTYVTIGAPNGMTIGGGYVASNNGLDVACYPDPSTAGINQPVTWTAEVTGGTGQYRYSWTGSDNLTGSQATAIKYYTTAGQKSAIVTVTSSDGRTGTRACSTNLTVRGAAVQQPVSQQPVQTARDNQNSLAAASVFSLSHIPWGWVALLIILVLFAMVMYLLFNKPKI